MAGGEPPTREGLAEQLNRILQQSEALKTTIAHERIRINGLETKFHKLTNYTNELERRRGTKTTNTHDSEMKRIMSTNL